MCLWACARALQLLRTEKTTINIECVCFSLSRSFIHSSVSKSECIWQEVNQFTRSPWPLLLQRSIINTWFIPIKREHLDIKYIKFTIMKLTFLELVNFMFWMNEIKNNAERQGKAAEKSNKIDEFRQTFFIYFFYLTNLYSLCFRYVNINNNRIDCFFRSKYWSINFIWCQEICN